MGEQPDRLSSGIQAGVPVTATDIIVRRAIRICDTIAYVSVAWHGEQVITFVRPFGSRGTGLWLRQVLHHPESGRKCGCPCCRWDRYGDTRGIDHMIANDRRRDEAATRDPRP